MFKKFHYQPNPNDPYFGEIQPKKPKVNPPKKRLIVGFHRLFILPAFGFLESPRNVSHPLMDPESNVKGMMGYSFHVATRGHMYAMLMPVKWYSGCAKRLVCDPGTMNSDLEQ